MGPSKFFNEGGRTSSLWVCAAPTNSSDAYAGARSCVPSTRGHAPNTNESLTLFPGYRFFHYMYVVAGSCVPFAAKSSFLDFRSARVSVHVFIGRS